MRHPIWKILRLIPALISLPLLKGCKPAERSPTAPGVSIELAYPVVLIGQSSLDVRDSVDDLISLKGASQLNLVERRILDSKGKLYSVERATLAPGSKPLLLDMGTSYRKFYVELRELPKPSLPEIRPDRKGAG